jgi:hypothetical protein
LHRYLYAYQNPMKYVDPDGREPVTLTAMALYAGWSGLNAGVNTGIDYGFHKVFGDERDEFNLGENLATNFAISATTGGVGAYAKHAPKLKKVGESAVEFSGEVYKEYNANKESGASIPQAAFDTAISMTIGKAASDSIGRQAGKLYDKATGVIGELKTKLGVGVVEITLPYKNPSKFDSTEYARQAIDDQAKLIEDNFTAGDLKKSIESYSPTVRKKANAENAKYRARTPPASSDVATTHGPDPCLGCDKSIITGYGDKKVNASIGSQNRNIKKHVYNTVKDVHPNAKLKVNVTLDGEKIY